MANDYRKLAEDHKRLQKAFKRTKDLLAATQKANEKRTSASSNLISKPPGQVGRGSGYNLQEAMGLDDNDGRYLRLMRLVKGYTIEHLSIRLSITKQKAGAVERVIRLVQHDLPFFQQFRNGWPVHDMIKRYLLNYRNRYHRDLEAEAKEGDGGSDDEVMAVDDDPDLEDSDDGGESVVTRGKDKGKAVEEGDDEDEDSDKGDEGDLDMGESALKRRVTRSRAQSTNNGDKGDVVMGEPAPKGRAYRSGAHGDKEDLDTREPAPNRRVSRASEAQSARKPAPKGKAMTLRPKLVISKPKSNQAGEKRTVRKGQPNENVSTEKKRKAIAEVADPKRVKKKRRSMAGHPTTSHPTKGLHLSPPTKNALIQKSGPDARGHNWINLQICEAIRTQGVEPDLLTLGCARHWPNPIDWESVRNRILLFAEEIKELLFRPEVLVTSITWVAFMEAIADNLRRFISASNKDKIMLTDKHAGYYGPMGEYLIRSTLMTIFDNDDECDSELHSTLEFICETMDGHDSSRPLPAMAFKDFLDFILVPHTAVLLISEDMGDDQEGARETWDVSKAYGLAINKNVDDEILDDLHRVNITMLGSRQGDLLRVGSAGGNIPRRHEKLVKSVKTIAIPVSLNPSSTRQRNATPGPLKARNVPTTITLGDYPSPSRQTPRPRTSGRKRKRKV